MRRRGPVGFSDLIARTQQQAELANASRQSALQAFSRDKLGGLLGDLDFNITSPGMAVPAPNPQTEVQAMIARNNSDPALTAQVQAIQNLAANGRAEEQIRQKQALPEQLAAWTQYDKQKEAYDAVIRQREQIASQDGFIDTGPKDDEGRPIDPNFGVPPVPKAPNLPPKSQLLKQALDAGVDLRPFYGETYADAVKFKQDLGQYSGKDQSMIIPANPVGYGGQFKFDPNFGSAFYRDLATQAGKALGLSDEQILQKGTEYFKDKFASSAKTAGVIGFTDFGGGLIDNLATTAGVPTERLPELKGTVLKPLYDASNQVFKGLNGAARVESQSSGFFKGIGQDIAKLGPIGTIALTAALGPAAGALAGSLGGGAALTAGLAAGGASALPGLLQGDLSGAIKAGLTGGALAGLGAGALKGVGSSVSNSLGGGTIGDVVGGAAQGAATGGLGSLLTGGDLGQGLLAGALQGGATSGVNAALNSSGPNTQLGTGITPPSNAGSLLGIGGGQNLQLGGGVTPPSNFQFGPTFNLPNTTGFVNQTPNIGGLFDDIEFPSLGLNPNATGLLDLGSGLGQGLTNPTSPNVPGQLGQGLTVGVPGGTLGQGGITPTGQITLGNPNSPINNGSQGSSPSFDVSRLLRGLLGAGTAAAVGNALTRSPQQQQTQQALPVQRFSMNPQTFNYTGDPAKYGETDIGNFQFYKPNIGLLG